MLLHDLLDDVEVRDHLLEVRGETRIDLGSIVSDSREATPGALFCCIPGRAQRRSRLRAGRGRRRARSRCSSSGSLPADVPQARVDSVRRTLGPAVRALPRPSVACPARARRHRHEREDEHDVPARGDRPRRTTIGRA